MIPFIRSHSELMVITQSRSPINKSNESKELLNSSNKAIRNQNQIYCKDKKNLELPKLPKTKRGKWIKSRQAISRFFDELDYNNQIQSSYDLTLIDRQNSYDEHNAA